VDVPGVTYARLKQPFEQLLAEGLTTALDRLLDDESRRQVSKEMWLVEVAGGLSNPDHPAASLIRSAANSLDA